MNVYTVHFPGETRRAGEDRHVAAVLVKEGFCWPAFFFSIAWALWHRMWWVALGLVLLHTALGLAIAFSGADDVVNAAVSAGVAVLTGLLGNDLRRWTLDRRGALEMGVAAGTDEDEAFERYLAQHPPRALPAFRSPFAGMAR